ncbi:hypothetical protein VNO78_32088 [Psophocarpus tetragonolobus]|uniref:Uncharacterized protein n=1 Tax=Psophocarpus tetragonolobus TaxID=3891 RepID=A0AAN9RZE6_PSOTE
MQFQSGNLQIRDYSISYRASSSTPPTSPISLSHLIGQIGFSLFIYWERHLVALHSYCEFGIACFGSSLISGCDLKGK